MNTHKQKSANQTDPKARDIVDYLRANPGFFNDHPELVAVLRIPDRHHGAVSLVERQIAVLREQSRKSKKHLHELIQIARRNEELARRLHRLSLSLIDAAEPKDIFATLYASLIKSFRVHRVTVRLFADPAGADIIAGDEFAGADCPEQILFRSIIDSRLPVSGAMEPQQRAFLFDDDILSAVIVPLHGKSWSGVLAIGSLDTDRFRPVMGMELLSHLGDVLSSVLGPWVHAH